MLSAVVTVSVVMVGTVGVVLILSVLVAVALLKLVIVPEPEWFTIPAALLVMPVIVPEPLRLIVPVFVKFGNDVVLVAVPLIANVPEFVLVVIEDDPPVIFTVPVVFAKVPVPVKEVAEFIVPVLVSITPVTVRAVAQVKAPLFEYAPVNVAVEITMAAVPPKVFVAPLKV